MFPELRGSWVMRPSELKLEKSLKTQDELVTPELKIVWIFVKSKNWDVKELY